MGRLCGGMTETDGGALVLLRQPDNDNLLWNLQSLSKCVIYIYVLYK